MEQENQFSFWRGLRLSSFQIGSAMGDILVTSIWNRILIVTLGIPATPVGLLIALRYLLSPLSLWAGHLTDNQRFFGLHRTPLIWLGRACVRRARRRHAGQSCACAARSGPAPPA